MNKEYIKCIKSIKELKNFKVDNTDVNIIFSAIEGIHGQIRINNNNNYIPFAYEENSNSISYLYDSFKYLNITKEWIIRNVENNIFEIILNLLKIDKMHEDISYINFATI